VGGAQRVTEYQIAQVRSVAETDENFGVSRATNARGNVGVTETIGKVVDAERVIERDARNSVEDAGEVTEVELLSVSRVHSHQLQSLRHFLVDQFVPNQRRRQTRRDVKALFVSKHILKAPLLHQLSIFLNCVNLDSSFISNVLPKNFLFGYFLRNRSRYISFKLFTPSTGLSESSFKVSEFL